MKARVSLKNAIKTISFNLNNLSCFGKGELEAKRARYGQSDQFKKKEERVALFCREKWSLSVPHRWQCVIKMISKATLLSKFFV